MKLLHIKIISALLFSLTSLFSYSQVVIGEKKIPENHAILELISTEKGLRHPQMNTTQRNDLLQSIADKTKAQGLTIYNTTTQCLEFYKDETEGWINLCNDIDPTLIGDGLALLRPLSSTDGSIAAGTTYGKYNYDVAQINFGGSCGTETRAKDFDSPDNYKRNYLLDFTSITGITDVIVGVYMDPYKIIKSVSGDIGGNVTSPKNTILVTFADNINQLARGTMKNNALEAYVYAVYSDNGQMKKVQCLVRVTDCLCCGVQVARASVEEWIPMMCHNLGADDTIDPMSYAIALEGGSYQWGRVPDGHEDKESHIFYPDLPLGKTDFTATPANELDGNGKIVATSPRYGKFIPTSDNAEFYFKIDWSTKHQLTLWGDGTNRLKVKKGTADPCPKGFRLPTAQEWELIAAELESTTDGWKGKGESNLFLPKSDYRDTYGYTTDAANTKYWCSCIDKNPANDTYKVWALLLNKKGSGNEYDLELVRRSESGSIRCIKE